MQRARNKLWSHVLDWGRHAQAERPQRRTEGLAMLGDLEVQDQTPKTTPDR